MWKARFQLFLNLCGGIQYVWPDYVTLQVVSVVVAQEGGIASQPKPAPKRIKQ
jgi:hypothetical protein